MAAVCCSPPGSSPGGSTIIALTSGITRQSRWRFVVLVVIACAIWAGRGAGLGYLFGNTFENGHRAALLIALGVALTCTTIVELVRHRLKARRERGATSTASVAV